MPRQWVAEIFERRFVKVLILLVSHRLGIPEANP